MEVGWVTANPTFLSDLFYFTFLSDLFISFKWLTFSTTFRYGPTINILVSFIFGLVQSLLYLEFIRVSFFCSPLTIWQFLFSCCCWNPYQNEPFLFFFFFITGRHSDMWLQSGYWTLFSCVGQPRAKHPSPETRFLSLQDSCWIYGDWAQTLQFIGKWLFNFRHKWWITTL